MTVVKLDIKESRVWAARPTGVEHELVSLAVYATDSSNRTIAGLVGGTYSRLAKVQRMWFLDEPDLIGIGNRLIAAFETHLYQRNCELCIVDMDNDMSHQCFMSAGYKEIPNNGFFASTFGPSLLLKKLFVQNGAQEFSMQ